MNKRLIEFYDKSSEWYRQMIGDRQEMFDEIKKYLQAKPNHEINLTPGDIKLWQKLIESGYKLPAILLQESEGRFFRDAINVLRINKNYIEIVTERGTVISDADDVLQFENLCDIIECIVTYERTINPQLPQKIISKKVLLTIGLDIRIGENESLEDYARDRLTYTVCDYPERTNNRVSETGYYHIREGEKLEE